MFNSVKVKIDKTLYHRLAAAAEAAGYASTDELIRHVLERAVSSEASDADQAERQLRGLGYLE